MKDNNRNFLALTALEEFWDVSRPQYFLGEWCRRYERKKYWENLDAVVVEAKQFKNKSHYEYHCHAISVYEKLLPKLAFQLDQLHQTQHSLKYWRYLIGPFLFWYTQIVYDRFLYLQSAYENNKDLETIGLSKDCYFTPLNTNELMCFASSIDSYNLQLLTQIIDLHFKPPIAYKKISREKETAHREINYQKINYKLRTRLLIFLIRLLNQFQRGKNIGVLNGDFSFRETFKLLLSSRFRILPILPTKPFNRGQALGDFPSFQEKIDLIKRKDIFNISGDDFLSQLVIDTLPINMPVIFIESYHEQVKLSEWYFPFQCAVILNEQSGSYDQYKFWIAEQREKGAKLLGHQHGGGYGMQKGHPAEWIECDVSDFFVSWGWHFSNKIISAPIAHVSRKLPQHHRVKNKMNLDRILWIATVGGVSYSVAFCNWLLTQEAYLTAQKAFFNVLEKKVISQLSMRASPTAYSQQQVKDALNGLQIHIPKNRDSFYADIDTAKIVIIDHMSTSLIFVLAFNIPTILFWDEKYFPSRDEAKPYIESLKRVGIYHDSPESAAAYLNNISDDPYPWWNSESVQRARQQFCDCFARTSPYYLREWNDILLNMYRQKIADSKSKQKIGDKINEC